MTHNVLLTVHKYKAIDDKTQDTALVSRQSQGSLVLLATSDERN